MKKGNFIIEIGCEDLPEWTGEYLNKNWLPIFKNKLIESRIDFEEIKFFWTVRRIIFYGKNVSSEQKDLEIEISGPPVSIGIDEKGNFTSAAIKFASAHNLSVKNLKIKEKSGKKVIVLTKIEKGTSTLKIIDKILLDSLKKVEIPRGLRWNEENLKFIRPIRWIMGIWENKLIEIKLGKIKSKKETYGHRILSPKKIKVSNIKDYFTKISNNFVIFDPEVRNEFLNKLVKKLLSENTFVNEEDIFKISNYIEYPIVEKGEIAQKYLSLPKEVIEVVVKRIKCLPIYEKKSKNLTSDFIIVFDGVKNKQIKENYEKVLEDKFEDALFFISQDTKIPFASYTEKLKGIIYHPKWGSIYNRIERFKKIALFLQKTINLSEEISKNLLDSISLCKNDLATLMVGEFPELQGVIGRIYGEKNNYNKIITSSIEQHYLPRFSGDKIPETFEGCLLSIIDRIENLCSFILEGEELSGSEDPFGLKKTASGIIEIIWNREIELPVRKLINETISLLNPDSSNYQMGEKVFQFLLQRIENLLIGEKIPIQIIKSIISIEKESILTIKKKVYALKNFINEEKSEEVFTPFTRVANILKQAKEKNIKIDQFSPDLLKEETEKNLYHFYLEKESVLKNLYNEKKYTEFLIKLKEWKEPVDKFFDEILVMCPEEDLRKNRLSLLQKINELFLLFADFSYISLEEIKYAKKN